VSKREREGELWREREKERERVTRERERCVKICVSKKEREGGERECVQKLTCDRFSECMCVCTRELWVCAGLKKKQS